MLTALKTGRRMRSRRGNFDDEALAHACSDTDSRSPGAFDCLSDLQSQPAIEHLCELIVSAEWRAAKLAVEKASPRDAGKRAVFSYGTDGAIRGGRF